MSSSLCDRDVTDSTAGCLEHRPSSHLLRRAWNAPSESNTSHSSKSPSCASIPIFLTADHFKDHLHINEEENWLELIEDQEPKEENKEEKEGLDKEKDEAEIDYVEEKPSTHENLCPDGGDEVCTTINKPLWKVGSTFSSDLLPVEKEFGTQLKCSQLVQGTRGWIVENALGPKELANGIVGSLEEENNTNDYPTFLAISEAGPTVKKVGKKAHKTE
ncbi:unnamed protein product, partial [Protopolystoma xenopodis]